MTIKNILIKFSTCLLFSFLFLLPRYEQPNNQNQLRRTKPLPIYNNQNETNKQLYFERIPNMNWTMYDISQRKISTKKVLIGVSGQLILPLVQNGMIKPGSVNRSSGANALIYNRIPKTSSSTMLALIGNLAKKNGFKYFNSRIYHKRMRNQSDEEKFVQKMIAYKEPFVFDEHFYTLNFSQHLEINFNWINVIRDPVDRVVSNFYYMRKKDRWGRGNKPPTTWFNKDFNTCVQEKYGWNSHIYIY